MDASATPRSTAKFQSELLLLKSQIESLQISVHHMQTDNATKEKALAAATRDKEQLSVDLKKQRRSNANLKQQLEDERSFYYKEKEQYCQEMNSVKKQHAATPLSAQKEIAELKNTLNQTLEANYNLSVKFLRMKNTKLALTKQINKLTSQHEESSKYCKNKVEELENHMNSLIHEEFYKPIPPSSKKYLHLLKNNGTLIHENLQLQQEVDRLHADIERIKVNNIRNETNSKLKLIHHDSITSKSSVCPKCKLKADSSRTERSIKSHSRSSQTSTSRRHHHHHHHPHRNQISCKSINSSDLSVEVIKIEKHGKLTASIANNDCVDVDVTQSKYDLMTVSNSNVALSKSEEVKSAPEISRKV